MYIIYNSYLASITSRINIDLKLIVVLTYFSLINYSLVDLPFHEF